MELVHFLTHSAITARLFEALSYFTLNTFSPPFCILYRYLSRPPHIRLYFLFSSSPPLHVIHTQMQQSPRATLLCLKTLRNASGSVSRVLVTVGMSKSTWKRIKRWKPINTRVAWMRLSLCTTCLALLWKLRLCSSRRERLHIFWR